MECYGKILESCRKLKNLWNMNLTVIPIVVGALGMVPKFQRELEIRKRIEIIHTTVEISYNNENSLGEAGIDLLSL